jgi:hypothetical protein
MPSTSERYSSRMLWLLFMIKNGFCKMVRTCPASDFSHHADLTKHYALFSVLSQVNIGDIRDSAP